MSLFARIRERLPEADHLQEEIKAKYRATRGVLEQQFRATRVAVEDRLKDAAEKSRDYRVVSDYIVPAVESERADKVLDFLDRRSKSSPVVRKLKVLRTEFLTRARK